MSKAIADLQADLQKKHNEEKEKIVAANKKEIDSFTALKKSETEAEKKKIQDSLVCMCVGVCVCVCVGVCVGVCVCVGGKRLLLKYFDSYTLFSLFFQTNTHVKHKHRYIGDHHHHHHHQYHHHRQYCRDWTSCSKR
jgi:hypothetical protein